MPRVTVQSTIDTAPRSCAHDSQRLLTLVGLPSLMSLTEGRPEIAIALLDGPVAQEHPDLAAAHIRQISPPPAIAAGADGPQAARMHGTLVAGVLAAKRGSAAPAICPGCTLLVRPVFGDAASPGAIADATPDAIAQAIDEVVAAGARIINLSAAAAGSHGTHAPALQRALNDAAMRDVLIVAAAGNHADVGGSIVTRRPWVIPVVACDAAGRPIPSSNLGPSIGRGGLRAPGSNVTSLADGGTLSTFSGTSAATPFVTGALALLWSQFPDATAATIRRCLVHARDGRRSSVVPPLLDASAAYDALLADSRRWLV